MKVLLMILSWIGIVAWSLCFTFGYNYSEGGALSMSFILGAALLLTMGISFWLMGRFAHPKAEDHKANVKTKEIASCVVYAILVALSVCGVAQFVTVQSKVQEKVRPIATQRMDELETVFGNANTPGSYLAYIEDKSATLKESVKANYKGNEQDKEDNINAAVALLQDKLTRDGQFENQQNTVINFLDHCRYSFNHWVPWTVTRYLRELDQNMPKWEDEVTQMSTASEWTANEPYKVTSISNTPALIDMVSNPEGGVFSGLAILVILVLQGLILLSYLTGRDWNRAGPTRGDKVANVKVWNGN